MSSITLIGGTARTGKSTLFRLLKTFSSADAVDADHLRWSLSELMGLDEHIKSPERIMHTSNDEFQLALDHREDRVFEIAGRYAQAIAWVKSDVIVCGTLRPEHAAQLTEHGITPNAVFLVDTDPLPRITKIQGGAAENNWQAGWPLPVLERWAELTAERAQRIIRSAGL